MDLDHMLAVVGDLTRHEDGPTCPYCDHYHDDDPGDWGDEYEEHEFECEKCGETFVYEVRMVQKFDCRKIEEDEDE